jgi:YggT family protein
MIGSLIWFVDLITRLSLLVIIAYVFLSYFLDPYHPVRRSISRIVDPLLTPIRRLVPPVGMIDLSPLVLLILIQVAGRIIVQLLSGLQ